MADSEAGLDGVTVLIGCKETHFYRASASCLAEKSDMFKSSICEQIQNGSQEPSLALDDGDPVTVRSAVRFCITGNYPLRAPKPRPHQQQQQPPSEPRPPNQELALTSPSKQTSTESISTAHLFHRLRQHAATCLFSTRYSIPALAALAADHLVTLLTHHWRPRAFVRLLAYFSRAGGWHCAPLFSVAYRMALLHWGELVRRPDFAEVGAPSRWWCLTAKRVVEYARLETGGVRRRLGESQARVRELEEEVRRLREGS